MGDFEKAIEQRFRDHLKEFTEAVPVMSAQEKLPQDRPQLTRPARRIIGAAAKALGNARTSDDFEELFQEARRAAPKVVPTTPAGRKAKACLHAWVAVCQQPKVANQKELQELTKQTERWLKDVRTCSDPAVAAAVEKIQSVFGAWKLLKDKSWPATLLACSHPAYAKTAVRIFGLKNEVEQGRVLGWIDAAGAYEELRDARARALITTTSSLAETARSNMQTPREHRKHFEKWVADLSKLERMLQKEASHQLEGKWLDRQLAPALTRTIAAARVLAEKKGVAELTVKRIKRIKRDEDAVDFVLNLIMQPAVVAQRNGKHGAGNEFIRALSAFIEAESEKRPHHPVVAILATALLPTIDSSDRREITPEDVDSLVKSRKSRKVQR